MRSQAFLTMMVVMMVCGYGYASGRAAAAPMDGLSEVTVLSPEQLDAIDGGVVCPTNERETGHSTMCWPLQCYE